MQITGGVSVSTQGNAGNKKVRQEVTGKENSTSTQQVSANKSSTNNMLASLQLSCYVQEDKYPQTEKIALNPLANIQHELELLGRLLKLPTDSITDTQKSFLTHGILGACARLMDAIAENGGYVFTKSFASEIRNAIYHKYFLRLELENTSNLILFANQIYQHVQENLENPHKYASRKNVLEKITSPLLKKLLTQKDGKLNNLQKDSVENKKWLGIGYSGQWVANVRDALTYKKCSPEELSKGFAEAHASATKLLSGWLGSYRDKCQKVAAGKIKDPLAKYVSGPDDKTIILKEYLGKSIQNRHGNISNRKPQGKRPQTAPTKQILKNHAHYPPLLSASKVMKGPQHAISVQTGISPSLRA